MPKAEHRLGGDPIRVNIVTFSGPHGVGKSTLINDLKEHLAEKRQIRSHIVPSVSTAWFKGYQEHARQRGLPVPETYDDINRLGIREMMQSEMPRRLTDAVTSTVRRAVDGLGGVVIVDRWFSDISTYTHLEMGDKADTVCKHAESAYSALLAYLTSYVSNNKIALFLTHIYVPVSSCRHELPLGRTADKAHRGTLPVDLWEATYDRVNVYTDPVRTVRITAADRLQRVAEVVAGAID